jgi:hypothetical protein
VPSAGVGVRGGGRWRRGAAACRRACRWWAAAWTTWAVKVYVTDPGLVRRCVDELAPRAPWRGPAAATCRAADRRTGFAGVDCVGPQECVDLAVADAHAGTPSPTAHDGGSDDGECSASRFLAGVDGGPLTIKESIDVTSIRDPGAGEGPGRVGILAGEVTVAEAARRAKVSETTVGNWKRQFLEGGAAGGGGRRQARTERRRTRPAR